MTPMMEKRYEQYFMRKKNTTVVYDSWYFNKLNVFQLVFTSTLN